MPKTVAAPSALMSASEVARAIGVQRITLERWVRTGRFPLPRRLPHSRSIRYRRADIEAWLESLPPAEYGTGK